MIPRAVELIAAHLFRVHNAAKRDLGQTLNNQILGYAVKI